MVWHQWPGWMSVYLTLCIGKLLWIPCSLASSSSLVLTTLETSSVWAGFLFLRGFVASFFTSSRSRSLPIIKSTLFYYDFRGLLLISLFSEFFNRSLKSSFVKWSGNKSNCRFPTSNYFNMWSLGLSLRVSSKLRSGRVYGFQGRYTRQSIFHRNH